jgi:hypothetical protein
MDPNAPLTTQPFTQAISPILLGFAVPGVLILAAFLLVTRWWDRRALRKAQAHWEAWQAAHPREPPRDDWPARVYPGPPPAPMPGRGRCPWCHPTYRERGVGARVTRFMGAYGCPPPRWFTNSKWVG